MMTSQLMTRSAVLALRSLTLGDAWHYRVQGRLSSSDRMRAVSGTIDVSVEPDPLADTASVRTLVFLPGLWIAGEDAEPEPLPAPAGIFSFVQDPATGDVSIVADNMGDGGTRRQAEVPQVFYPGRWSCGSGYANRLEFGGGAFVRNTLAVIGQEQVETPVGRYDCWVAAVTSAGSALGDVRGTDWWTPELGAPVRFETNSTTPDGECLRLLATLASMNLAPDPVASLPSQVG